MVQGFYGLDEAAAILGMPADQLNQMAQKREIRAFADRGTWRFRSQDIDEMARRMGHGSAPELQLGEPPAKPPASPSPKGAAKPADSPPPKSASKTVDGGVFDFSLSP